MEPQFIAEPFADHFFAICNLSSSANTLNNSLFTYSDFLNIPHTSKPDVKRSISRLRSTKCVGPGEDPNFITKGCSEIFTLL
jgi:hypothetical protein